MNPNYDQMRSEELALQLTAARRELAAMTARAETAEAALQLFKADERDLQEAHYEIETLRAALATTTAKRAKEDARQRSSRGEGAAVSEADAYNAYLVAVADERTALQAFYATDDAQPFDQTTFDEAQEQWTAARYNVNDARNAWYKAGGDQHNPEKIRL